METETIPDIMAEMRYGPIPKHRTDNELLRLYADRIDDALNPPKGEVVKSDSAYKALAEIARITNAAKSDFDIFAGFERILKISNSALCEIRNEKEKWCYPEGLGHDCPKHVRKGETK